MGMFDSFIDKSGREWQTKAYDCIMNSYRAGDKLPGWPLTYQVRVISGRDSDSCATIVDGRLWRVPAERDESMPYMDYFGRVTMPGEDA